MQDHQQCLSSFYFLLQPPQKLGEKMAAGPLSASFHLSHLLEIWRHFGTVTNPSLPSNKFLTCRTQGSAFLFCQHLHSDWACAALTADGFPSWKYLFAMENKISYQIALYKVLSFLPGLLLEGWNDTPFSGWCFCPSFLCHANSFVWPSSFVHASSKHCLYLFHHSSGRTMCSWSPAHVTAWNQQHKLCVFFGK